jgi:endoglucanase
MKVTRRGVVLAGVAVALPARGTERLLTGVNLAGLEFNAGRLPGRVDHDFVAPTDEELDYWRTLGASTVRVPFLWERLQPDLDGAFDRDHWRLLDGLIDAAAARSMRIVLDPHQYGRRRVDGQAHIIGEGDRVTAAHFASFWRELASRCRNRAHVIFNLQNEPHDQDRSALVRVHNAVIEAIRESGASQLILAPGSSWSGAHSWRSSGNAEVMLGLRDPAGNLAFDVHQYLDRNSSGTGRDCTPGAGARLEPFTRWAREHGKRGFLGEFGAADNQPCLSEFGALLDHISANRDVWIGWTCWGAGPWWPEDYPLKLSPASLRQPRDRPQAALLRRYFE